MTEWLKGYATKYPNITWLYSIGESVQNRTLWVLAISKSPRIHALGVPEFKYVANMHGNEVFLEFKLEKTYFSLISGVKI